LPESQTLSGWRASFSFRSPILTRFMGDILAYYRKMTQFLEVGYKIFFQIGYFFKK
jgi:hypothetical protein